MAGIDKLGEGHDNGVDVDPAAPEHWTQERMDQWTLKKLRDTSGTMDAEGRIRQMSAHLTETSGTQGDQLPENEMKFDQESIPVQLLPTIPLMCVAKGYGYGARKYFANSWRRRDRRAVSWMRTYGSILRHLLKWAAGEEWDRESVERGQPMKHLWFAATQLFILIEHTETGMGDDDRHKNEDADILRAGTWPKVDSDKFGSGLPD